jgi:hypothetical protein
MGYTCKICNATFPKLSNYEKHLNKKTTCDPIKREQQNLNKLKCHKCQKILSSTSRLKTHLEICKIEITQQDLFRQMLENLTKQNEILAKQNEILVENMNKQTEMFNEKIEKQSKQMNKLMNKESTININNTVNQQQNIYNILPFGKEKMDHITDKEYKKIFTQGYRSLQMLIPLIYCNEEIPENMNIYISNFNDNSIKIYDGKNWIIENKSDVLTDMYNSKRDYLEIKFDDMYDNLGENAKYFFEKFKEGNTDPDVIKSIQHDIKNILYANRNNIVKKPTKKTKKVNLIKNTTEINDPDYIPDKPMFF